MHASVNPVRLGRVGLVGLGAMGRNLGWRLTECGVPLSVYSYAEPEFAAFSAGLATSAASSATPPDMVAARDPATLLGSLPRPRTVLIMVTAGSPVDRVIGDLLPGLAPGDLLIDGGNSHFDDTRRRATELRAHGVGYLGVGISGGEAGARHGASIMVGGEAADAARAGPVLDLLAARTPAGACIAHVGPEGAGHFVKMVHNGIEYALMQVIAEVWQAMHTRANWDRQREQAAFRRFASGPAASYLVDLTAHVLGVPDPDGDGYLLDHISDRAAQKGTGRAALAAALDLGVAVPGMAAAVLARMISSSRGAVAPADFAARPPPFSMDDATFEVELHAALYAGFVASFAQGFDLLVAARAHYGWSLDLAGIARIWQGGCIIRAALLETIETVWRDTPDLAHLLAAPVMRATLAPHLDHWRRFVSAGTLAGYTPACAAASLAWCDALQAPRLPTSLIQAQRDAFGAHGFERVDRPGQFHASWSPP